MNDFRYYAGADFSQQFLTHYGVGHEDGGHSGRYAWGSGESPMQDSPLNKGSESKPHTYVPSKSIVRNVDSVLKKLKENKITIETLHTARADVAKANQEYLSYIGYGKGEDKAKLNREEKTQTVLNVQANNHKNRPHARHQKIAEGTAQVKIRDSDASTQHMPAIYGTNAWHDYVPFSWAEDTDLQTIDGTTNDGYRPDPVSIPDDVYDTFLNPISNETFLTYYGQEREKLEAEQYRLYRKYGKTTIDTVLNMARAADKVVNTVKKLTNVIVRTVRNFIKHNDDEGLLLIQISTEDIQNARL